MSRYTKAADALGQAAGASLSGTGATHGATTTHHVRHRRSSAHSAQKQPTSRLHALGAEVTDLQSRMLLLSTSMRVPSPMNSLGTPTWLLEGKTGLAAAAAADLGVAALPAHRRSVGS